MSRIVLRAPSLANLQYKTHINQLLLHDGILEVVVIHVRLPFSASQEVSDALVPRVLEAELTRPLINFELTQRESRRRLQIQ